MDSGLIRNVARALAIFVALLVAPIRGAPRSGACDAVALMPSVLSSDPDPACLGIEVHEPPSSRPAATQTQSAAVGAGGGGRTHYASVKFEGKGGFSADATVFRAGDAGDRSAVNPSLASRPW